MNDAIEPLKFFSVLLNRYIIVTTKDGGTMKGKLLSYDLNANLIMEADSPSGKVKKIFLSGSLIALVEENGGTN